MRYLLLLILFSCTKQKQEPSKIDCDFGLSDSAFQSHKFLRKPKKNDPPPPPPPTYPGQAVIFLDFDGDTVRNTSWNTSGDIICEPSGLSTEQMTEILNKVSIAYGAWDVSVTTSEVAYNLASRKTKLILTTSWEWYGQSGGVAFLGSMLFNNNTPCFVFTSLLGYNTKYIKEASCHEIGHTIGLYHQSIWENGLKISEYNYGCCGFAPIMGVAYYQLESGWITGYNSFGAIQNDTLKISSVIKKR